MSLDITIQTVQPSLFRDGEGYQDRILADPVKNGRSLNDRWSGHRRGGVGGRGMRVLVMGLRDEISPGGRMARQRVQAAKPRGLSGRGRSRSGL